LHFKKQVLGKFMSEGPLLSPLTLAPSMVMVMSSTFNLKRVQIKKKLQFNFGVACHLPKNCFETGKK
jgi:hypothetical protein